MPGATTLGEIAFPEHLFGLGILRAALPTIRAHDVILVLDPLGRAQPGLVGLTGRESGRDLDNSKPLVRLAFVRNVEQEVRPLTAIADVLPQGVLELLGYLDPRCL